MYKVVTVLLFVMLVLAPVSAAEKTVDFVLSDLDNRDYRLSDFRGKWVVVNYWATWCPPCIEEMPELVFFHDKHKDRDAVVVGINIEDVDDLVVRNFLDEHMITYPVLLTEPAREGPLGSIPALPTTFLVDPQGRVVDRKVGRVDQQYLEALIKKHKP